MMETWVKAELDKCWWLPNISGKTKGDCAFQYSLCNWVSSTLSASFPWNRTTGEILENDHILGPTTDHQQDKKRELHDHVSILANISSTI